MRFKPPPPNSDIGWRVEFRPMEVTTRLISQFNSKLRDKTFYSRKL